MSSDTEPCPPPSDPQWLLPEGAAETLTWQRKCPSCEEWFIEGPDICPFCGRHLP